MLAICVLARLAGKVGSDARDRYVKSMSQEHVAALDARWDARRGCCIPPARMTLYRVMVKADSDEVQAASTRWVQAHLTTEGRALAADGKRINGVNRTGAVHHDSGATLVAHAEGIPVACRVCNDVGGKQAAVLVQCCRSTCIQGPSPVQRWDTGSPDTDPDQSA